MRNINVRRHCTGKGTVKQDYDGMFYVECKDCGATTAKFYTPEDAINHFHMISFMEYADYILKLNEMIKSKRTLKEIEESVDKFISKNYTFRSDENNK